ncbi:uncharacterized protein VTP21DRAFT_9723 [Calcarisporiella thermophila]|uniref:uncharacterized protein n=1 Tax=Calcarisporiella thermophila TaxID=911321 RepID=UPI003742AB88
MTSQLQKDMLKMRTKLSSMPPPSSYDEDESNLEMPSPLGATLHRPRSSKNYSPLSWEGHFDECEDLQIPGTQDIFRFYRVRGKISDPLYIFHHGAGHSALSFGLVSLHMKQMAPEGGFSILAYDCRGHGLTKTSEDNDFSLTRLAHDLVTIVKTIYKDEIPDIILVGHSMGGSVITEVAHKRLLPSILGFAVLDIVEGSAMYAMKNINAYINSRPTEFQSMEQAIKWMVRSGTVHNVESARLSVPPLLVENAVGNYAWRTDLNYSRPFWTEWFQGLSDKFLNAQGAKLLILASTDYLDKELMIGQMQGKFQLIVFSNCGHAVEEDDPERMASTLLDFMRRNQRLVLPKKVPLP